MTTFEPYPENILTGRGWVSGNREAEEWYNRTHGIDPETGAITGPAGLVPHGVGLQWQQRHMQAVYGARQNFMRQGQGFQEGALGILQSFRPGGGAYQAADIYSRMAQLSFQRAAMTQPMNFLLDYERHQAFEAQRKAKKRAALGNIGGLVQGLAPALALIPGAGPFLAAGATVAGAGLQASGGGGGGASYGVPFANYLSQGFGMGQQQQQQQQPGLAPGQSPPQPITPGSQPAQLGAPESPGQPVRGQPPGQQPSPGLGEGIQQTMQGVQWGSPGEVQQQMQQGQGQGSPPEGPTGSVQGDPMQMALQGLLQQIAADMADDPSWESLDDAINEQLRLRRPMSSYMRRTA